MAKECFAVKFFVIVTGQIQQIEYKYISHVLNQSTCSCTSSKSELSISMKMGTAPAWITTRVWWDVPEAMLVNTHAASNWQERNIYICCLLFMCVIFPTNAKHTKHIFCLVFIAWERKTVWTQRGNQPAMCSFLFSSETLQSAQPLQKWQWLHQLVGWALLKNMIEYYTVIFPTNSSNLQTNKQHILKL